MYVKHLMGPEVHIDVTSHGSHGPQLGPSAGEFEQRLGWVPSDV